MLTPIDTNGAAVTERTCDPEPSPGSFFPNYGNRLDGISDNGEIPPDVGIAAGYNVVFQSVNDIVRFTNKCGTWASDINLDGWLDSTYTYSSTKVAYDDIDSRWIIAFDRKKTAVQQSQIVFLTSDDGDPYGWWSVTVIDIQTALPPGRGDLIDIGFSDSLICATWDGYVWGDPSTQNNNGIIVLEKLALYYGGAPAVAMFSNLNDSGGSLATAIRPARMRSPSPVFWLASTTAGGGNSISLWTIIGGFPNGVVLGTGSSVSVGPYDPPPPMIQPDATVVDAGDSRLGGLVFRSDTLYACHTEYYDWGEGVPRSILSLYKIEASTLTLLQNTWKGASGRHLSWPGIDIDDAGRAVIPHAYISTAGEEEFLSARFAGVEANSAWTECFSVAHGQTNYSHAGVEPWQWGGPLAVAIDPGDNKTFWVSGPFASNTPDPSWDTEILSVSWEQFGLLNFEPTDTVVVYGPEGGPFEPAELEYSIGNSGTTGIPWEVTSLASWMSADPQSFTVPPLAADTCRISILADDLPAGEYLHTIWFNECYGTFTQPRTVRLIVGENGYCRGGMQFLAPNPTPSSMLDDFQDRGIHITAIDEFEVCLVGMSNDLELPQIVTANIYELNGGVRTALVASGTLWATQSGEAFHYVPVNTVLHACHEYEIAFEFGESNQWPAWDESLISLPVDFGSIRVRDGASLGNPADPMLPYVSIVGEPIACEGAALLEVPGAVYGSGIDNGDTGRGVYVTANRTIKVCQLGMVLDPPDSTLLVARIYEATGTTRGDLVAMGTAGKSDNGMGTYWIPVNATLLEGENYDFEVSYPSGTSFTYVDEDTTTLGFLADDAVIVLDGEANGNASTDTLCQFGLRFRDGAGGVPFSLVKPGGPPPPENTEYVYIRNGMYVTMLTDEEIYAVDFMGDLDIGYEVTARIYEASGTTRGSLIAEGTVQSTEAGMRWHTIPVSASMATGQDYDIEIDAPMIHVWRFWRDTTGLPYEPYGVIRVNDAEHGGDPSDTRLIELRLYMCDAVGTDVGPDPVSPPAFYISRPYPNPAQKRFAIRYNLDKNGPVSITVYNVKGQRVATLMDRETLPMGPGTVSLDATRLASGIYFVRMTTPDRSVTRKIAVVR